MARLKEIGALRAPITDTASTFGFVKWNKLCKVNEIKPVFGIELAVTASIHEKKPVFDYWTFIAKDSLEPIHRLLGIATQQFRYEPLLTIDQALEAASEVNVIVGHRSVDHALSSRVGLWFGLGPAVTKGYFTKCIDAGLRPVMVCDNRFVLKDQKALYEVTCGRTASTQSYPQWITDSVEWSSALPWVSPEVKVLAFENMKTIFEESTAKIEPATMVKPEKLASLRDMCIAGAKKLNCNLEDEVYLARLNRELDMIASKNFEDYFYLVSDICRWARNRMIVGPARGSSCGSLVCYLLEITTVDPIPYGLIFERFIDINRNDLPDIDIDFSETKRQLVFDYITQKYGKEHVARLGTVAMFQPRSALKETAGALDVPPWELGPVMDAIIDRSSGDARALQATEDTLKDTATGRAFLAKWPEMSVAAKLEGHPRHAGQHAAGVVITDKPVTQYVAVDERTGATMCDKKDAEDLNLLKIDALGLTQLSIFEDALELAGLPRNHLFTLPFDDDKAFDVLRRNQYAGIFQFNGLALQSITGQIEVDSLNDIVAITALGRPGPLNAGGTNHWIKVRTGQEKESYAHELFRPYLKDTLGVVTYQEQVMIIGREIGDLSWEDVSSLRKAMSKSMGKEFFDKYGDRWKKGAREKGIPEDIMNKVWDDLCAYGSWCFNKSHAVAYGIISYWCCWMKAHYPLEFAAATLTHNDNPASQIKLLRELANEGVSYVPCDPDISIDKWTVGWVDGKKALVGPLDNVKGIGPKMQSEILSARRRGEPLTGRALKLLEKAQTKIDSIYPVDDRIQKIMPLTAQEYFRNAPKIIDVQPNGSEFNVMVFCTPENIKPRDENEEMTVAKRNGRRISGKTAYLNLRLADDTDVIFAKVDRFHYEKLGTEIVERGRPGKALYAMSGSVPRDFRMIRVTAIRYLGDLEDDSLTPVKKESANVKSEGAIASA